MAVEDFDKKTFKCPACQHIVQAELHSGVTAVFCRMCGERIQTIP